MSARGSFTKFPWDKESACESADGKGLDLLLGFALEEHVSLVLEEAWVN